uniref:PLD phosphodiesterase domain-containing protein n=1 Tax=Palpitomonas bilix TaxID=652834 RepID=A0A7S3LUI1_9EUKA|mmetsp:Transcript_47536/g.123090  ORF Transcript_47536/g.123090 Transcript_47536/m.123090 type:complete len:1011 (+) Transcript_47536:153-3185(+)
MSDEAGKIEITFSVVASLAAERVEGLQQQATTSFFVRVNGFGLEEPQKFEFEDGASSVSGTLSTLWDRSKLSDVVRLCTDARCALVEIGKKEGEDEHLLYQLNVDVSPLLLHEEIVFPFSAKQHSMSSIKSAKVPETSSIPMASVENSGEGRGEEEEATEERPSFLWESFNVSFCSSGPILSSEEKQVLNPLEVEIATFDSLPQTPIPVQDMSPRFLPPYASLSLAVPPTVAGPVVLVGESVDSTSDDEKEKERALVSSHLQKQSFNVVSHFSLHSKKIKLKSRHVFCLGSDTGEALWQYFNTNSAAITLHDRDIRHADIIAQLSEKVEDIRLMKVAEWSRENKEKSEEEAQEAMKKILDEAKQEVVNGFAHPAGEVEVRLREFCDNQTHLSARSVVCLKKGKKSHDTGGARAYRANFMESGTICVSRFHLFSPPSGGDGHFNDGGQYEDAGPFQKLVFTFPYFRGDLLVALADVVARTNKRAVGLEGQPDRFLSTFDLPESAAADGALDIITGVEVIQNELRMIILEGLKDGAMKAIAEVLERKQRNEEDFYFLFNSGVSFRVRQYATFGLTMKKIRLKASLSELSVRPEVCSRSRVSSETYGALWKLREIERRSRMIGVKDLFLFPSALELLGLEKKYGDVLQLKDITGGERTKKERGTEGDEEEKGDEQKELDSLFAGDALSSLLSGKRRYKAALDDKNDTFEHYLSSRSSLPIVNHVEKNILSVAGDPRRSESQTGAADLNGVEDVFIYSGQKLQYSELQKEAMRKRLAEDRHHHYTYSKEYATLSFALGGDELEDAQSDSRPAFKWPYPKAAGEWTKPDFPLSQSRVDELNSAWVEEEKESNRDRPSVGAAPSHLQRRPKFDSTAKKGGLFEMDPAFFQSVHGAGVGLAMEKEEAKSAELNSYHSRLAVKDDHFHAYWGGANREHPSQLDRKGTMLKGAPRKKALQGKGLVPDVPFSMFVHEPYQEKEDIAASLSKKGTVEFFLLSQPLKISCRRQGLEAVYCQR